MTSDEITTMIAEIEAAQARIDALPRDTSQPFPPWGRDSKEQTEIYNTEVYPKLLKLYDYVIERSGKRTDFKQEYILRRAAIYAADGYWGDGSFSPDDDLVFFPDGTRMTQEEAGKIGYRRWIKVD